MKTSTIAQMRVSLLLLMLCAGSIISAQDSTRAEAKPSFFHAIQPIVGIQLWSYLSHGGAVFDETHQAYEPVDMRFNTMVRRTRIGAKAKVFPTLEVVAVSAIDLVGRDVLDSGVGGSNNGALPSIGLWDAYLQWQVRQDRQGLYLVAGYFTPQLGRESLTSAFAVNSLEKAFTQNYIRRHLTGTGPGRAAGLNVGGVLRGHTSKVGLNYNVGIFNPVFQAYSGNSMGRQASPLLVGRAVLYLGEPEMKTYRLGGKINAFHTRKGLSIGIGGAWQGRTDLFRNNFAIGIDGLLNWGDLNVDGEWMFLGRSGSRKISTLTSHSFTYFSGAGHLRIGYNLLKGKAGILEPVAMVSRFQGASDHISQADAIAVGASSGIDQTYDLGLNWYLKKNRLKLSLHYTWRHGNPGEAPAGAPVNLYFYQKEVGGIQRGNWLGLGIIAKL